MGPADLKQLADALRRDEIERARAMSPDDKLLAGPRLFDQACRMMADGIRAEHPRADEAEVQRILRERLDLAKRLEQRP